MFFDDVFDDYGIDVVLVCGGNYCVKCIIGRIKIDIVGMDYD